MKFTGFFCALICALNLSGCLEATKVARLTPEPEDQQGAQSVTLSLPRTALAEFGRIAEQLVIRAYKVDNGVLGPEVRDAYKFPVTDDGLYSLDGLPLGEVEIQLALLDENNQMLAEGFLRTVINPGSQTLPQVILKPKKPSAIDLDLSLALQLVNFPDAPVQIPAEPEAMRAILKKYKCQTCHNNGANPTGGLNLQSYPYKNSKNESLAQILTTIIHSFSGSEGVTKMPPNGTVVNADDAATVSTFLQTVNEAISTGSQKWVQDVRLGIAMGGPGRFETTLALKDGVYVLTDRVNLIAGSRYAYALTVFGPGGSKLYEVIDGALDIPLDGKVQLKVDLVYQAPAVTLPVIVEQ